MVMHLPPLLPYSCLCCCLGKLFPLFVFQLFVFSSCQGLCRQDNFNSSESPMPLKTTQTLTQPFVPSSRILLPLLGADGGVKVEGEQLAWPLMLGASAGADFNRCFAQAFFLRSKNLIYISASSQRHARNE